MIQSTQKKKCESCGATDELLECAGCLSAYFCSTTCQQQTWPNHKKICRQNKNCIVKIQSNWRGHEARRQLMLNDGQDRCEVCGVLDGKDVRLDMCDGCKMSLFCSVRCQQFAWYKRGHKVICQERQAAAFKVQSMWRTWRKRKQKERRSKIKREQKEQRSKMKREQKKRERAALTIQSAWWSMMPVALLTDEALVTLLSPDGYYKYLGIPRNESTDTIAELVMKNHRQLSLQHYKKKRVGDAELYMMLNRAMVVLSSSELRSEYDVTGFDLEDNVGNIEDYYDLVGKKESKYWAKKKHHGAKEDEGVGSDKGFTSSQELVMEELYNRKIYQVLTALFATGMTFFSTVVSEHFVLVLILLAIFAMAHICNTSVRIGFSDMVISALIVFSILCMSFGREGFDDEVPPPLEIAYLDSSEFFVDARKVHSIVIINDDGTAYLQWSWLFWFGEMIILAIFLFAYYPIFQGSLLGILLLSVISPILSLWLRGRFWIYVTLLGIELGIVILGVTVRIAMELALTGIAQARMRKVGEKIRIREKRMQEVLGKS